MKTRSSENKHWYAIYTKSRFEKKVHANILKLGMESFLPMVKEKRVWSDRLKTVEIPLLPSYVFVQTINSDLSNLYYIPGFVRVVSFEGQPCEIQEKDIELLKTITTSGVPIEHTSRCAKGDWAKIIRGPFKDWEGYVEQVKGQSKVVFCFDCINQFLSVEVSMLDVQVIENKVAYQVLH